MSQKSCNVCDNLPTLTQKDLCSNLGNQFRPSNHSPLLYDDIFDEKQFNDLASDPLLNTGQMEIDKNGNGNGALNNSKFMQQEGATSQLLDSGGGGGENGASTWNGNFSGNYFQNGFGNVFLDPGTSSGGAGRVEQTPASRYPTSTWQPGQPTESNAATIPKPLTSSNTGPRPLIGLRSAAPFIRVKQEPQETTTSSDHDRGDNYSVDSTPSTSAVSRGAVYAREYRRKNKNRISKLEEDNERLWRENATLKEAYRESCAKANALSREVAYLRQVLANDAAIANLLNAVVSNTSGLKFQCPLVKDQTKQDQPSATTTSGTSKRRMNSESKQRKMDENEARNVREDIQKSDESPGVCLHVNGDMVSVEFCPRCNRDARRGVGDLQQ